MNELRAKVFGGEAKANKPVLQREWGGSYLQRSIHTICTVLAKT